MVWCKNVLGWSEQKFTFENKINQLKNKIKRKRGPNCTTIKAVLNSWHLKDFLALVLVLCYYTYYTFYIFMLEKFKIWSSV